MSAKISELKKQRIYSLINMDHFESLIEDYETHGSILGVEFCKAQIDFHNRCLEDCRNDFFNIHSQLTALDSSQNM